MPVVFILFTELLLNNESVVTSIRKWPQKKTIGYQKNQKQLFTKMKLLNVEQAKIIKLTSLNDLV